MPDFRQHLPRECPPDESLPAEGEFFRLVSDNIMDERAFLSMREIQPKRKVKAPRTECHACGVSLYQSRSEVDYLRRMLPDTFGSSKVARGTLSHEHGKMLPTPSRPDDTHTTFWPYANAEPWIVFQLLAEDVQ